MEHIISENIKLLLSENEMSLHTLAERAKMDYQLISDIADCKVMPSVHEVSLIANALNFPLYWFFLPLPNFLSSWHLTLEELGDMVVNNPSLRGFMVGYMAESKIRSYFLRHPEISNVYKPDDHDRTNKCDIVLTYKHRQFTFEVKSLQTNSVKKTTSGFLGTFQCDASDRREIELPNGHKVNTTNLKFGDFDIVAINLFAFTGNWDYAFALNMDLPQATPGRSKKAENIISDEDLKYLIKSSIKITYPLELPFVSDPVILMNRLLQYNK